MPITDAAILSCDPFAGDYGGNGDRVFSDRLVRVRKPHSCTWCTKLIRPKCRARRRVEMYDGALCNNYWCWTCCRAMVAKDDGKAQERQISLGRVK